MSYAEWFYARNGQSFGPFDIDSMRSMLASGNVTWQDYVWKPGMPQWSAASGVPEFTGSFAAVANPPAASQPAGYAAPAGASQYAYPNAGYGQAVYAPPGATPLPSMMDYYGAMSPPRLRYAGFWLRFWAWLLDLLVLLIPSTIMFLIVCRIMGISTDLNYSNGLSLLNDPTFWVQQAVGLTLAWLYYAAMESSGAQATLGKMALGLKVTDEQGRRISFGRASARQFGKIISGMTFYVGYIMAGITQRKQALHDMMAACLIVRSRQ